jgi:flagellar basal-body rod modification protein FlgD
MATLDDVQVNSTVGIDGNTYTTAISNDKLTNDDFLKLLLEELKMQDPTEPMDSSKLMDSQLKMSTIQANVDMASAMTQLQASYANSALSNASNLISRVVENGEINDDGLLKSFKVQTVESVNGELYINAYEMLGYLDTVYDPNTEEFIRYDSEGELYDSDGNGLDIYVKMADNRFVLEDDKIVLLDNNGEQITDEDIIAKYTYGGEVIEYSDELDKILVSSIQKIW